MQKEKTINAIRKAHKLLRMTEEFTNAYDIELDYSMENDQVEHENPFFQLGEIVREKHGNGFLNGLLLVQYGLLTILYYQGKVDEESYQDAKSLAFEIIKEVDALTPQTEVRYLN